MALSAGRGDKHKGNALNKHTYNIQDFFLLFSSFCWVSGKDFLTVLAVAFLLNVMFCFNKMKPCNEGNFHSRLIYGTNITFACLLRKKLLNTK